ncbi:uncharacterized protein TNCV_894491 [Trichonephila clavipes]|nr:uncharacterized protein TNCV_894491 [Trichonephila clavipes]
MYPFLHCAAPQNVNNEACWFPIIRFFFVQAFVNVQRLTWAREHSLWTIKDWEKVIFSEESQFCISGNQSSAYVRRQTHEEFSPQCLKPTVKYPTKVMVWGCMSSYGVGRLHIVRGIVKAMDYIEILQNKLLPTVRDLFGNQS